MKFIKTIWTWLSANLIFPVAFLLFGALSLRWLFNKAKPAGQPDPTPEEIKIRDEVTRVEVEAAGDKAGAVVKAEIAVERLKEAGSDPDGKARREKLAAELNK